MEWWKRSVEHSPSGYADKLERVESRAYVAVRRELMNMLALTERAKASARQSINSGAKQ